MTMARIPELIPLQVVPPPMPIQRLAKLARAVLIAAAVFGVVLALNPHLVRMNVLRVREVSNVDQLEVAPEALHDTFRFENPAILAGFSSPVALPKDDSAPASERAMEVFRNLVTAIARSPENHRCWNPESPELIASTVQTAECRGYCSDYAILFSTLAQKAGLPARRVVMEGADGLGRSVHVVTELWLDDLQKWVMFDPTYFVVVEDPAGNLQSARDLRESLLGKPQGELRLVSVRPGSQLAGSTLLKYYRDRIGDMQYASSSFASDNAGSPFLRLVSMGEAIVAPLGPQLMMIPRFVGRLFVTRTRYRVMDQWNPVSYGAEDWFIGFRVGSGLVVASLLILLFNARFRDSTRSAGPSGGSGGGAAPLRGPDDGQPGRAPPKRAARILLPIASTVIGLLVALLMVELGVRLFVDTAVQPRYVIDPGYGVRANQPNVSTRHYVPGDYDIAIHTNSSGMRGLREYPVARVAGKRRTLVLGDSFAFGYGVEDDQVVSAVLEDLLNARRPGSAEVLNLAVSGFGQAEELVTWEARGTRYKPDVVVLFYFNNDIGNNAVSDLYSLGPGNALVRTGKEYLPGSRLQERLFQIAPIRWLFEHSQAWNLIRNRLSSLVQRSQLRGQGLATYDDATPSAVALTRALLAGLVAEIEASGALPVIVTIPDGRTLQSNFPLSADEVTGMGARFIDGRTIVTGKDYYTIDSHWRPEAHRRAAEGLVPLVEAIPPG